jgi:hypothetical protein
MTGAESDLVNIQPVTGLRFDAVNRGVSQGIGGDKDSLLRGDEAISGSCTVAVSVGCRVLVGCKVSVGAWVEIAVGAAAAAGDTKPPDLIFMSKLARMTRMNVVMAAERNNVFLFIPVWYLLKLDSLRDSCRQGCR